MHIFATNHRRNLKLETKRQVNHSQPPLYSDFILFSQTNLQTYNTDPTCDPTVYFTTVFPHLRLGTNNFDGSKLPPYPIGANSYISVCTLEIVDPVSIKSLLIRDPIKDFGSQYHLGNTEKKILRKKNCFRPKPIPHSFAYQPQQRPKFWQQDMVWSLTATSPRISHRQPKKPQHSRHQKPWNFTTVFQSTSKSKDWNQ